MTRTGLALWLLAMLFVAGGNYYAHRAPQQPRKCPPECARCGHSWGPSNKPWCTPKNMEGME